MKRWKAIGFCVIVAAILLSASRIWRVWNERQQEEQALKNAEACLAAEARLAELSEMEVAEILINSFGKEYILNDPEEIRAVQDALLKIEPKVSDQNDLGKYDEPAAGARSMALHFFRSDGTKERLTLDDFDAETPCGTMAFTAKVPGYPNAISLVFDAFYPDEEQLSYGYAYLEQLCGGNVVSLQASYNGESRSLEDREGIERVLTALLNAELEANGSYGPSSDALTLEFFYEGGGYARMRVPCFKTEGKFGMELYEVCIGDEPADEAIWNLFSP